jgi:hypothetical protein
MKRLIIIMGLLTTLLNFFGCSGQTDKKDEKLSKVTEEQIAKSIEDFKNRPIHKVLTEQIIDTTLTWVWQKWGFSARLNICTFY